MTAIERDRPTGSSDGSRRSCWNTPPGEDVVSFSPQIVTDAWPRFVTRISPLALEPSTNDGRCRWPVSRRSRGPGTSSVRNEPIWFTTLIDPPSVATGVTRKPTKYRSGLSCGTWIGQRHVRDSSARGCEAPRRERTRPAQRGSGPAADRHLAVVAERERPAANHDGDREVVRVDDADQRPRDAADLRRDRVGGNRDGQAHVSRSRPWPTPPAVARARDGQRPSRAPSRPERILTSVVVRRHRVRDGVGVHTGRRRVVDRDAVRDRDRVGGPPVVPPRVAIVSPPDV